MDYDVLNNFLSNVYFFASKISLIYSELKGLELNGLFGMPLYQEKANELKLFLIQEKDFYNSYHFSDEELDYMISFIAVNFNIDENESLEFLLHNQRENYNPVYRIYFRLSSLIENHFDICGEDEEEIKDEMIRHIKFQKNLLTNYCSVIESFVSSYLLSEQDYQDELLYIKYLLPFINSDIEKVFLKEFKFKENILLDFKFFGDLFRMSNLVQNQYINLQLFERLVDEINNVLEIEDRYFKDNLKEVLISEIIIKSVSVFFSEQFINDTLSDLNEHIIENAVCFCDNQLAVQNVFNLREITKKDKERFAYLSLKLPRN